MVDDNILKPGSPHCHKHHDDFRLLLHLFKENYLSEFLTEEEKQIVRDNLKIYTSKEFAEKVIDAVTLAIAKDLIDLSKGEIDVEKIKKELAAEFDKLLEEQKASQEEDFKKFEERLYSDFEEDIKDLEVTRIVNEEAKWIPKGPVQSMVGFIEDDTVFPKEGITLQQLADAIFYGTTESVAEIFVGVLTEAQKDDWIQNGVTKEKIDALLEEQGFVDEEEGEVANSKYHFFNATLAHAYDFSSKDLSKKGRRYIAIAYPNRNEDENPYPKLRRIETGAQQFGPDAFWKPSRLRPDDYNFYIYKVGISELSTSILVRF